MSIHFKDAREILSIFRDVVTYMYTQNKNDELGNMILNKALRILEDNEKLLNIMGETNGKDKQTGEEDSHK